MEAKRGRVEKVDGQTGRENQRVETGSKTPHLVDLFAIVERSMGCLKECQVADMMIRFDKCSKINENNEKYRYRVRGSDRH